MPDPDRLPQSPATKGPNDYPNEGRPATHSLVAILRERLAASGPMRFADFMAAALYEPGLGYYAKGNEQVGKGGDFFTSVSVGPLFGELLARRFQKEWEKLNQPERWRIIECGAHDGKLAEDILSSLSTLEPDAVATLEYLIPEPLEALQQSQRQRLKAFAGSVRHVKSLHEVAASPLPGIAFGNELLDALPCHLIEFQQGAWQECRVALDGDGFKWELCEITDPALQSAVAAIGVPYPNGYRTEVRTNYADILQPLAAALTHGTMLWIDYGFAREDYYHPDRTTGTLRTFAQHQADEDPLIQPGDIDITAHVDFTAVAEAAKSLGGQTVAFKSQGAWLTETAREWLQAMEGHSLPCLVRQFQTLTHPAQLGSRFHVLELTWDPRARSNLSGL